jgi:hypothetical protein
MGELQHGIYADECEDLMYKEINELHGFGEDGELINEEEDNQSDDPEDYELGSVANSDESDLEVCTINIKVFDLN